MCGKRGEDGWGGPCDRPACNAAWVEFAEDGWYAVIPCPETICEGGVRETVWHGLDFGRRAADLERDLRMFKREKRGLGEPVGDGMEYDVV